MDLLTQPICLSHYLIVGAVLFVCGVVCMTIKRNAVGVLMGVELVLNGANLNFVAFSSPLLEGTTDWGSTASSLPFSSSCWPPPRPPSPWPSPCAFTITMQRSTSIEGMNFPDEKD